MRKLLFITWLLLTTIAVQAQQETIFSSDLKMEEIMQGEDWTGVSPTNPRWSLDSKTLYFQWKQATDTIKTWYAVEAGKTDLRPTDIEEKRWLQASSPSYTQDKRWAVYEQQGDIYLWDVRKKQEKQLTNTSDRESSPLFIKDDTEIAFRRGNTLYSLSISEGKITQLSYTTNESKSKEATLNEQKQWLKDQQEMFDVLQDIAKEKESAKAQRELLKVAEPSPLELAKNESVRNISINNDADHLFYIVQQRATDIDYTKVPNYVTETGYLDELTSRPKVGSATSKAILYHHNLVTDSITNFDTSILPGIQDLPDYLADYPERKAEAEENKKDREVSYSNVTWNVKGNKAVFAVYSQDNKDRWIVVFDANNDNYKVIDRQRDEAWIAGPGISRYANVLDWIDNDRLYFQSEKTGYSHLYLHDIKKNTTTALTSGEYEVQKVDLAADKKHFYIQTNKEHPGITHYYKLQISNKELTQLTQEKGGNRAWLSPDEEWLAILHSTSTSPWELYVKKNKPKAKLQMLTKSTTKSFDAYAWQEPEMVTFTNRNNKAIHARVYTPEKQHESRPAVVFVHGAGYLQNVHYWWSQYYREYMFHNLLTDLGYTVIDIDYTASSGYGRDIRTGIYRHMGGADLTDQVDGVQYLVDNYNVNPDNVGIYGGSYGGFISLMALFTEQEVFAAGAGLRSVTDWAHYNHGYTSNILNQPYDDPIAYERSSPINFADGLEGALLMCHGMIDVNVQFQDIVRLSQRLIELEKDNWELAVYPLEDHGFVHASSWIDEYKRILKLFENTLK